jgi:hypothetical protein
MFFRCYRDTQPAFIRNIDLSGSQLGLSNICFHVDSDIIYALLSLVLVYAGIFMSCPLHPRRAYVVGNTRHVRRVP